MKNVKEEQCFGCNNLTRRYTTAPGGFGVVIPKFSPFLSETSVAML